MARILGHIRINNTRKWTIAKSKKIKLQVQVMPRSKATVDAKEIISELELTNNIAINVLHERYRKKTAIVNIHYSQLIDIEHATIKTHSLRTSNGNTENHLRSL